MSSSRTIPTITNSPGKERDSETQLDYFGARYYSNGLGRWVSADWSPTPIPVPYADFHDPQSLNLYGFVGGNPASKADPDGHFPVLALAGGGALVEFGGPILASNPVGWAILGVAAVATIGYVAYEHFQGDKAQPKTPDKTAPAGAVPGTQTKAGPQSAAQTNEKSGEIYVTGPQASGKAYVGKTTQGVDKRMQTRRDGRTGAAKSVDKYKTDEEGSYREQKEMDKRGGKGNLDNKRDEVNPKRMKELEKKYGNKK